MTQPFPVITVSREFGSGGHSIALALSKRLGVPFFDKEIVLAAVEKSGFSEDFVVHQGEHLSSSERFWSRFLRSNAPGYQDPQDELYAIQRHIILDYAASPCIIVGRTADHILREAGVAALNVFVHASDDFRAQRVLERYGATDTDIVTRLREKDRARADFYEHFTGLRWGDARNFHVSLDSSVLGVATCVDIIVDILREEEQRDH